MAGLGNFFKNLFGDVLEILVRNLNLSPDDVAKIQAIETAVKRLGEQVADKLEDVRDEAVEALIARLDELEERLDDFTNGDTAASSPKSKAATAKEAKQ